MQCHLPNFCSSANCAWGICLCCLPFGFPYISISGSSGGSEWILNFISVFNFCSRTLQCKLFASTFCFTLQRTKTFLNRPTGLFLGISWKKACRVRNLVVPVPTSALREALLLNGHHLTHLLQTHGEMWIKLGVLTVYLGRQPCRSNSVSEHRTWGYQLSVICKTTLFQIIMSSYWKHRVAETTLYLQIRGSRSTVDKVRLFLFGNAEKLRTIKVSLPGQGYTFLCYWGDSPVILPT